MTMKKLFTLIVLCAAVASVSAQKYYGGNKFTDNWSVGVKGGVWSPANHYAILKARSVFGIQATKMVNPVLGFSIEGMAGVNANTSRTFHSSTMIDFAAGNLLAKFNLNNLFCGYKGEPDRFEVVAFAGLGYMNAFVAGVSDDPDFFNSKLGLDLNYNLGKAKAWQITVSPAIVYALHGADIGWNKMQYNYNRAALELTAGVNYKFGCSNGSHNFTIIKPYDQAEVDGLNAKINDLRGQVENLNGQLRNASDANNRLKKELNDCRNQKPVVKEVVVNNRDCESVVSFRQGKSVVDLAQMPNVERVATYLNNHKDAKVVIKGYASPEGSLAWNEKLAKNRAEAVKKVLVKKYKIAEDRITAEGQGIGKMFSEPDWNRVSIATME